MKKFIIPLAVLLILFAGYQNRTVLAQQTDKILYHSACDTPIPYRIGTIDKRFNITTDAFAKDIEASDQIWSSVYGKPLFVYDQQAAMTVNLIYDERQQLNSQINQLDTKLKDQDNTLKPEIAAFERRSAEYRRKLRELNQEIDQWNSKGGAPEDVYNRLKASQAELQQEASALNALAKSLNQSTDAFNAQVQELNQTVDTYNTILHYKPEEGIYIADGAKREIIIYFNNSRPELIHTLAHEMGHALGMEHTSNPQAIMFGKTNAIITPAKDDLALLTEVCRKRSIIEIWQTKAGYLAAALQQGMANLLNKATLSAQRN